MIVFAFEKKQKILCFQFAGFSEHIFLDKVIFDVLNYILGIFVCEDKKIHNHQGPTFVWQFWHLSFISNQ